MELSAALPLPDAYQLWPEHVPAAEAFLAVATQWRTVPYGRGGVLWQGLDYGAVQAGLALAGLTLDPERWAEVRLIEAGAIEAMNEAK